MAPDPEPACASCDDSGWVPAARWGELSPCTCREQAIRRRGVAVVVDSLPARVRTYTRASWSGPWPFAGRLAADWPSAERGQLLRPWLVACLGETAGVGKTHAATALFVEALEQIARPARQNGEQALSASSISDAARRLSRVMWISAADAARQHQEEIQARIAADRAGNAYDGGDTRRRMHEAPLLLLDDIGRERDSDATRALIVATLVHRHANALPTIITAQFAKLTAFDAYDPALTSRLAEDSLVIGRSGRDQRRPGQRAEGGAA